MRSLLRAVILLVIVIAAFGYFRGWFHVSTGNTDHNVSNREHGSQPVNGERGSQPKPYGHDGPGQIQGG